MWFDVIKRPNFNSNSIMYNAVENQFYPLAIISVPFTAVIVILFPVSGTTLNNPRRLRAKAAVKRAIIIVMLIAISTFPARA
jgi:hypothetical protein